MASVQVYVNGRKAKSKKAIKEAFRDCPDAMRFQDYSMFDNKGMFSFQDIVENGWSIAFCGPDVNVDRRYYGTIDTKGVK